MHSRLLRRSPESNRQPAARVRILASEEASAKRHKGLLAGLFGLMAAFAVLLVWLPFAQAAEISATQMKVSVWPEYDDPRVLVINQADLDPSVTLPAEVSFNIPKGADIGMACEVDSGGGHACKPYQLVDKGDYQTLTYKVEAQHTVFLEYYYDAFAAGTPERSFDFTFRPGFSVKSLTMEVQEPLRSTGFTLDPILSQTATDSQGLTYHTQEYADVAVDKPLDVKVSYSKTDNNPSVAPKDSSAGAGTSASGSASGGQRNTALFIVLAALAFGTLLFGGYKVFRPAAASSSSRSGRRPARGGPGSRRQDHMVRNQATGSPGPKKRHGGADERRGGADDSKFCTECGAQLRRQDRFCSGCGSDQA